jgi:N-glycosylase/DNA lyase
MNRLRIQENNSISNTLKKIKYLEITKDVHDVYKENYNHCRKKSRKVTEDRKTSHAHGLTVNLAKIAVLPKAIYVYNAIPIKIPMIFIIEIAKSTLKFIWKHPKD